MTDHPNEDEIGRFFRGETSTGWQGIVAHLCAGCELCRRRCTPWLDLLLHPESCLECGEPAVPVPGEDVYDEVLDRVFAAVRPQASRIATDRRRIGEALANPAILDASLSLKPPRNALRGWPLVVALLQRSFELRYRDPVDMCKYAFLAYNAACHLDEAHYSHGIVADVRARAAAELANAYRVKENHREALRMFREAERWHQEGTGDLSLRARFYILRGSLWGDQRRFRDALDDLAAARDSYETLGEHHLAGRATAMMGFYTHYSGDSRRGLELAKSGLARLDPAQDRGLVTTTQLAILDMSLELGEYREAAHFLFGSGLRHAFAGEPLNLVKLRWVEGKVFAGLGRLDRAEHVLAQVRLSFDAQELSYNSALAGLDLLAVHLRQRRLSEVAALAAEILEVFERLLIGREALRAAEYLELACREGLVTLAAVQHVARFLTRFERDPSLVFAVP